MKGYKSRVTHSYKEGKIREAERAQEKQRIDDAGAVLNQYIKHYGKRSEGIKGSGIRRRRQCHVFFQNFVGTDHRRNNGW